MKKIGGYFSLERPLHRQDLPLNKVNSGTSGLEIILKLINHDKIYVPYFICGSVFKLLDSVGQKYECYHVDENLEIIDLKNIIDSNRYVLYVNYFGVKDDYCNKLKSIVGDKLVLDLTQAFFYQLTVNDDVLSFSSVRKFFGVPDGGFITGCDSSLLDGLERYNGISNCTPLLYRADGDVEKGYGAFKECEKLFEVNHPMLMSGISEYMLSSIDFKQVRQRRKSNFEFLNDRLRGFNDMFVDCECVSPLVYPYMIKNGCAVKKRLIENKIFVSTYWSGLECLNEYEANFVENLVCIPIDQRYEISDMDYILKMTGV